MPVLRGARFVPTIPNGMPPVNAPAPDLSQDRAWLDGFRAGHPNALERVFRSYAPLVFRVVQRGARLPNGTCVSLSATADQDDVVQDTFLRLLGPASRERYDGIRPYAALVRTVARNALVDHLRKRGKLVATAEPTTWDDVDETPGVAAGAAPPQPDENLLSAEEARVAADLLASLDEDERKVAKVRFEQGLSQRDAAESLGVSRQNVRTMESRLLAKGREFLRKRGW
jgi:RNA polymerase sigma factor (sigma-70 family)